jgi:MFS transporter, OFA family, oxalate/formate antiporter
MSTSCAGAKLSLIQSMMACSRPTVTKIYYGWFVVIGTFLATMGFGIFFSFGVFYTPLLHEFGWTKTQTASLVSVAAVVQSFGGLGIGGLSDRFGPGRVLFVGAVLLAAGVVLASASNLLWEFYLFYGIVAGLGWSTIATVPLTASVKWFARRRSLATGITTSGSGMGGTIFPPLAAFLMEIYGWRGALAILGLAFSGLVVLASIIVRERPPINEESTQSSGARTFAGPKEDWTFKKSIRTPSLWLLFLIFFLPSSSLFLMFTYLPPLGLERGLNPVVAAGAVSALSAISILARLTAFTLVRAMGTIRSLTLAVAGMSLSTLLPFAAFNLYSLYGFSAIYGISYGVWIALTPAAAAEIFGRTHYGQIWGVVNAGGGLGGVFGPILAGLFLDYGGFDLYLLPMAGAMAGVAAVLGLLLFSINKPSRRKGSRAELGQLPGGAHNDL